MELYKEEYYKWLNSNKLTVDEKSELESISNDENIIKERFYTSLEFGTAGLRGKMRVGTNAMNTHTVAQATQGLANLIIKEGRANDGVVIAYDSRNNSESFAKISASVLAANGIKAYIFDELRPTPELSFALRELKCVAGINITASHNPKEYNGYKAYWEDGAQLPPEHAKTVSAKAQATDIFEGVKKVDFDCAVNSGAITIIGSETDEAFLESVLGCMTAPEYTEKYGSKLNILYTALHGTGYKLVPKALSMVGVGGLVTVDSQMTPDGNFPTVASPNPENKECFAEAIKLISEQNIDCNMIIGTDPDADRVGLCIRDGNGEFFALNGNQIGALLTEHIIKTRKASGNLPENACAIKSVVSANLFDAICEREGVRHISVLTGFKYIGEKIKQWEADGSNTFIFGYEESQGYLSGGYARDKDAVGASVLLAEMACRLYSEGKTVYEELCGLYEKYGYYRENVVNVAIGGINPMKSMSEKMASLRVSPLDEIAGEKVTAVRDYSTGIIKCADGSEKPTGLPESDMIYYELADGSAVIVRPSGTEPKIKAYILTKADTLEKAIEKTERDTEFSKSLLK